MAVRIRCPMCGMLVWLSSFGKKIIPKLFKQQIIQGGKGHSTFDYKDITGASYNEIRTLYVQRAYQIIEFFETGKPTLAFEFYNNPKIEVEAQARPTLELGIKPIISYT